MNPVTQWIKAALESALTPSQQTAFLALLLQTAGYGKVEDDLADSRLEKLSGLRRDRARAAVAALEGSQLVTVAGKGRYGTVYRIPERFLADGESGSNRAAFPALKDNMAGEGMVCTATVQDNSEAGELLETRYQQLLAAHQTLLETNQHLVDSNRQLVSTNQNLVDAYQQLVNGLPKNGGRLPKSGEALTESWVETPRISVTDTIKPRQDKTATIPNPASEETSPERWTAHWDLVGHGDDDFQVWEQYAAATARCQHPTPASAGEQPAPTNQASGITAEALQYPAALTAEELTEAPKKLDGLHPQMAQEVLDALAWKMANGEVKKSNIGLLVWLAKTARMGTFDRTPALEWRKRQAQEDSHNCTLLKTELSNLNNEVKTLQGLQKALPEGSDAWDSFTAQIGAKKAEWYRVRDMLQAQAGRVAHGAGYSDSSETRTRRAMMLPKF